MKKAFTLIELLVVIAIIAILAAILFPVFAQAKQAAKKAGSISNLKQFGLASKMYENDNDDNIVQSQFCATYQDATSLETWENQLYPYIKNGENVVDKTYGTGNGSPDRDKAAGIWADPGAPDNQSFPYGINFRLAPDNWGYTCDKASDGQNQSVSEGIVARPSDAILIMTKGHTETKTGDPTNQWGWVYFMSDEYGWTSHTAFDYGSNQPLLTGEIDDNAQKNGDCDGSAGSGGAVWGGCGMLPRYRYSHTCPVAFVDGHAKAMSQNSISFGKNIYVGAPGQGIW